VALLDLVRQLGEALLGAAAPGAAPPSLTSARFTALAKLIGGLPVDDILAAIEGRGSIDTDLELAERVAALVGVAFPPGAITAGEVEGGLEALQFLLDAAGLGANPFKIQGGVPAAFPPGGGPGPYRGR
jgi:hypothetical protein